MRQRVAFARTLLAARPVLLLDEPFASLDAITRGELQEWTGEALAAEPRAVLLVTHDIEEALYLCDRVLVLSPRPGRVRIELPGARGAAGSRNETITSAEFSRAPRPGPGGTRVSRAARLAREWAPPALLLAALVAGWEVAAQAGWVEDYLLPAPSEVARALVDDRKLLLEDAWVTGQEVLLGFALALAVGVAIAVALHVSGLLRRAVYPLVVASQAVPVVVIAPILVIWFGFGMTPKLIVIALICFFPIVVNTLDGLRAVDPAQAKMLRTLGADRWALLRRLELPAALPFFFSGAKIAVAVAVIGAVFGELVGSDAGLGHAIQVGMAQLLTARVFAAVVILSAMAIGLFALVSAAERLAVPWAGRRKAAGVSAWRRATLAAVVLTIAALAPAAARSPRMSAAPPTSASST